MALISLSKFRGLFIGATLLGASQIALAGPTVDQLSNCLMKSTTPTDKTVVLQWTFVALGNHPDLKAFSNVTATQKEALDKNLATVLQRIVVEQCSAQTKAVIQTEGLQAVGDSFQELGSITGEEILKTPEINTIQAFSGRCIFPKVTIRCTGNFQQLSFILDHQFQ